MAFSTWLAISGHSSSRRILADDDSYFIKCILFVLLLPSLRNLQKYRLLGRLDASKRTVCILPASGDPSKNVATSSPRTLYSFSVVYSPRRTKNSITALGLNGFGKFWVNTNSPGETLIFAPVSGKSSDSPSNSMCTMRFVEIAWLVCFWGGERTQGSD